MNYNFEQSLGKLCRQISREIGNKLEERFLENDIKFRSIDWMALSYIKHHNKLSQNELSVLCGFDKVTINRIIERLEEKELIIKEICPEDKRIRYISLSKKGTTTFDELKTYAEEIIVNVTDDIPEKELKSCLSTLIKISQNLEK